MKSFTYWTALAVCAVFAVGTARAQDKSAPGVWDIHHQNTRPTTQPAPTTRQPRPGVLDHGRVRTSRPVVQGATATARPGWDKGRKTGWGDCDVPPGQAKKVGCTPGAAHRGDHRWVQRRDRRWQERREAERREAHRRAEHRAVERHEEHRQVERHEQRREAHREAERRERRHERVEMAKKGHR